MRRTVVACLVLGLVIGLLPISGQAQEITAVFHFEKPAVVKPGDSVTITWELTGGTAPHTISEGEIVFTDDTSTQTRSLRQGDSVEVQICHTFHVRLLVSDAAGVQKELLSDGIPVDKSEPYSCTIALDKTSLAVGEEITATWTYTGGEGYGQWITVDKDNHTTYVMDRDSLNVKSGSSTFTPTIGTRGYFELSINRYNGGSSLSAKERSELFTITNGGQIGQPTCEIVFDKTSVLPGELITANYTFGNVQEPLDLWLEGGTYFYAEGASSLHPESKVPGKSMTFRVPVNATQVFAEIRGEDALGRPFDFEKAAPLQSVEGGVPLSARITLDQAALTKGATLTGRLII